MNGEVERKILYKICFFLSIHMDSMYPLISKYDYINVSKFSKPTETCTRPK